MVGVLETNVAWTPRTCDIYLHSLRTSTLLDADGIKVSLIKRKTGECYISLANAFSAADKVFVEQRLTFSGPSIQLDPKLKAQLKASMRDLSRPGTEVPEEAIIGGTRVDTVLSLDDFLPLMMACWRAQAERNTIKLEQLALDGAVAGTSSLITSATDGSIVINFEEFSRLIDLCTDGTISKRRVAALYTSALQGNETLGPEAFVHTCYLHGITAPP